MPAAKGDPAHSSCLPDVTAGLTSLYNRAAEAALYQSSLILDFAKITMCR